MGKFKILAKGETEKNRANNRGRLFELLMAKVLRNYGYKIEQKPNVNYAGMEIDIEGKEKISEYPLYAECKCYEIDLNTRSLEVFYGKYMTRWFNNKKAIGLFIALPGINSHAKAWFKENIETNKEITIKLFQEEEIISLIFEEYTNLNPSVIKKKIPKKIGKLGDWVLIYSDHGFYIIQYIIPLRSGIPSHYIIFDRNANLINDSKTIDYLINLYNELKSFEIIKAIDSNDIKIVNSLDDIEQVVEVQGSSSCFEYQFPASPQHFVGREQNLMSVIQFSKDIVDKHTSSRGILFEANSGWGKSSIVLSSKEILNKCGHYAVAIDSRSASSSHFILKVMDYVFKKFNNFSDLLKNGEFIDSISGFNGVKKSLIKLGKALEENNKVLFIFLDQFEVLFYQKDALKQIRNLFFKIQDLKTNIVFGFSWKTDLVGLTSEFPYRIRDDIKTMSKHIVLNTFSNLETDALLKKLETVIKKRLRKEVKFFLSEFSQGYPWLLKKLCAHVKTLIEMGKTQIEIANSLLNIEELFQKDLSGLSTHEEDTLRRIAKLERISIHELGELFKPEVVQSLVNRRLLVRIGNKYDLYWDIFKDYLITGRIPIQENYLLRTQIGSVLRAVKRLSENDGELSMKILQEKINLKQQSFYNVLRDLRVLGLVQVKNDNIILTIPLPSETPEFEDNLRLFLKEKLGRNRIISQILQYLDENKEISKDSLIYILKNSCPYISATENTWNTYSKILIKWIDFSDLANFDGREAKLKIISPGSKRVRIPILFSTGRHSSLKIPSIQYGPIEKLALRLVNAYLNKEDILLNDFKRSTISKSLHALELLAFIERDRKNIILSKNIIAFYNFPGKRSQIFRESALKNQIFKEYVDIYQKYYFRRVGHIKLGGELGKRLGKEWMTATMVFYSKILLNWVKNANIEQDKFKLQTTLI